MTTESREQLLRENVDEARQLATVKPTGKNIKALKAAQRDLDEYLASLDEEVSETFKNVQDVIDYLDATGWKIGKSTAYDHWKKDGKLRARPDGRFDLVEVERYAKDNLQRKDGAAVSSGLAEEKQKEEILRIRADRLQRELKYKESSGELIARSRVEIEFAERAENLKTYFNAVSRSSAGRIIKLVGGDPQKAPELIQFLLGLNRKAFDNYSRPIGALNEDED